MRNSGGDEYIYDKRKERASHRYNYLQHKALT